ncbi:MAG: ABC transporter permease [Armatimonadetes bacterium]|nr:ABC transporter permease [Armatimonadota bacterium]
MFWQALLYSTPVSLAALGEVVGQRAGQLNIGLEGVMLSAAYAGMAATYRTHNPWIGVLAAVLAALLISAFQAFFTIKMALDQVVVGTAINLFAMGLTNSLFRAQFGTSGKLISIPGLPKIGELDPLVFVLLLAVPLVIWTMRKTRWGLAVRASGEYPDAAESAGFSVVRLRFQSALIAGFFAGLAGAHLSICLAGSFAENMTAGRGFLAIAMVTFGRWKPGWVVAASLLVGGAEALQYRAQAMGIHLPFQLLVALPYILSLVVLIVLGKGVGGPASLGVPYRRNL